MHELSIMSYLLDLIECQAGDLGATKVLAVNLTLGERAGIDDSLLFYFDQLTPGTVAEGARLTIRRTQMRFHCERCKTDYAPEAVRGDFGCASCGAVGTLVDDACDLRIDSLEIET